MNPKKLFEKETGEKPYAFTNRNNKVYTYGGDYVKWLEKKLNNIPKVIQLMEDFQNSDFEGLSPEAKQNLIDKEYDRTKKVIRLLSTAFINGKTKRAGSVRFEPLVRAQKLIEELRYALNSFVRYYEQSGMPLNAKDDGSCNEWDGDEIFNVKQGRRAIKKAEKFLSP